MNIVFFIVMIIVAVWLGAVMFKYDSIEAYFFNKNDGSFLSIGNKAMKICVSVGALVGATAFIYQMVANESAFSLGLSSVWGFICNGLPYIAFAVVAYCLYKVCMIETSTKRIVLRSIFLVLSCVLGMIGGAIASVVAIVVVIFVVLISAIFKINLSGGSGSGGSGGSSSDDYDSKITDESGNERKLKDVGFGRYQDDKGDYWKSSGFNSVERE